jgi:hypothetical protein
VGRTECARFWPASLPASRDVRNRWPINIHLTDRDSWDVADETHSAWTLDLVGVSGRTCTVTWRALRKWHGSRIVYEHHYDEQQNGGPLTSDDLSFNAANLLLFKERKL